MLARCGAIFFGQPNYIGGISGSLANLLAHCWICTPFRPRFNSVAVSAAVVATRALFTDRDFEIIVAPIGSVQLKKAACRRHNIPCAIFDPLDPAGFCSDLVELGLFAAVVSSDPHRPACIIKPNLSPTL